MAFGQPHFQKMEKGEEFSDVQILEDPKTSYQPYIDNTSVYNFYSMIILLIAFIVLNFYSVLKIPEAITNKKEYFGLTLQTGSSVDLDLSLSQILQSHKFVQMDMKMLLKKPAADEYGYSIQSKTTLIANSMLNSESKTSDFTIKIPAPEKESKMSELLNLKINDIIGIRINLKIGGKIDLLDGVEFYWSFYNPNSTKYINTYNLLVTLLIFYMLIIYLYSFKFNIQTYHQIFLLIIGISAIFSTNPLGLIFTNYSVSHISNFILSAIFLAIFRMYILILLKYDNNVPSKLVTFVIGIVFMLYGIVGVAASYNRNLLLLNSSVNNERLSTENMLMFLDIVYIIVLIVFNVLSLMKQDISFNFRSIFFLLVSVFMILSTLYSDLNNYSSKFKGGVSVLNLLQNCIYVTCASFLIFMFHKNNEVEYQEFDEGKNDDQMVLDIEQMESGDDEKSQYSKSDNEE